MELRVYRTFRSEVIPGQEVLYGGPPLARRLVPVDSLQLRNEGGEWMDVPVFEAERPQSPPAKQRK